MLEKGLSARSTTTVTAGNTAVAMGSGDLEVFATPAMVALMENVAMRATAILAEAEGRKLTFNVGARDAEGMIGEGVHVRFVVDRAKFMSKVK